MKLKLIFAILSFIATFFAMAQESTQLQRVAYKLTVAVDKKTFYEEAIKATPYVLPDNTIQLYPGETVFIEIEQENGIIRSMKAVEQNMHPNKTLSIRFSQTSKNRIHQLTMLHIENPFTEDLIYTSKIFLLHQRKWVDTNVYPVSKKLSAFETWPDIITSIALAGWEFKSK